MALFSILITRIRSVWSPFPSFTCGHISRSSLRSLSVRKTYYRYFSDSARTLAARGCPPHAQLRSPSRSTMTTSGKMLNHHFDDSPTFFVWVDCEMSGLDLKKDHILEIACIITDSELNQLEQFGPLVVHQDEKLMNSMNEWCTRVHAESGLTQAVLASSITMAEAQSRFLHFLKSHIPTAKTAYLAGNSVHVDRAFLCKDMPLVVDFLHYRIVDVSSIKVLCSNWYPKKMGSLPPKALKHRSLDDILESIEELKWYRESVFLEVEK